MDAKQGWIDITTGAINTTFTVSLSFQPKIVLLWWNGRTESTDTVGGATHRRGFGAFTGTGERMCVDTRDLDAQGTSVGSSYTHDAAAVIAHTDTTLDGLIDVDLVDSSGFRLIVDDVMPYALRVGYLALGGSDVVNAKVGAITAGANGDYDLAGLAFQPNFAMLFTSGGATSLPSGSGTNSIFCIGAASGSANQVALSAGNDDGSNTMDAASYCTDNDMLGIIANTVGTTLASQTDFTSFTSDGWDLTGGITSTVYAIYVALNCTNVIVGNSLTRTDGNDIVVSGLGWKPAAGLVLSHCAAETTTTTLTRHDKTSIGAFTGTAERGALGVRSEDNVADSNVATAIEHDAVYVRISTTNDTVDGLMDVKSVDSGGVTFVMDDTDPDAAYFGYILFGPFRIQTPQSVSGGITPSGVVVQRTNKPVSGALTSAGTLVNSARKVVSGALTSSGTLVNSARKILDGAITPSGIVAAVKIAFVVLEGALTSAGALALQTGKAVAGAITPDGGVVKQTTTAVSGALTSAGDVAKRTAKAFTGELTPAGIVAAVKTALMAVGGELTAAGALVLRTSKTLTGSITPSGELVKRAATALSGALTSAGALILQTGKSLAGTIAPEGGVIKRTATALSGALSSAGDLATQFIGGGELFFQAVAGALTSAGTLALSTSKSLAGTIAPEGSLVRLIATSLAGELTSAGALIASKVGAFNGFIQSFFKGIRRSLPKGFHKE